MSIETLPYREIEKKLASIEATSKKRIGVNYAKIVKEINAELRKAFDKYGNQDDSITFQNLMTYVKTREFDEKIEEIIKTHTRDSAVEIKNLLRKTVASSYDLTKSEIEQEIGRKVKGVLNPATINEIIQDPISGLRLDERLAKNRAITTMMIKEELEQGLIQGKRYKEIANRISDRTGMEAGKALRIARTESHRCLEAGKYESVNSAAKEGTKLLKWWKNGDDERVRPGHVYMGTKYNKESAIPFEEDFVNDRTGGVGPHPGKLGVAADDINCRCMSMIEIVTESEKLTNKYKPKLIVVNDLPDERINAMYRDRIDEIIPYDLEKMKNVDKGVFYSYQSSGYRSINSVMRGIKPVPEGWQGEHVLKRIETMKKAFDDPAAEIKVPIQVYRGIDYKVAEEIMKKHQYTDPAFVSTTTRFMTAKDFSTEDLEGTQTVLSFVVPKGKRGIALLGEDEYELILEWNLKMKLTAIEEIPKKNLRILHMVVE